MHHTETGRTIHGAAAARRNKLRCRLLNDADADAVSVRVETPPRDRCSCSGRKFPHCSLRISIFETKELERRKCYNFYLEYDLNSIRDSFIKKFHRPHIVASYRWKNPSLQIVCEEKARRKNRDSSISVPSATQKNDCIVRKKRKG